MGYSCSCGGYSRAGQPYHSHAQAPYRPAQVSYQASGTYSIDNLVSDVRSPPVPEIIYSPGRISYEQSAYHPAPAGKAYDVAGIFLNPIRPATRFVNQAWQIKDYIIEAFRKVTGDDFPEDIIVKVCGREELKAIHALGGSTWKQGILGFAVNNRPGTSEVFVQQDSLDRLMLVIGHELGHVLSQRLDNAHDEEAKAFAFELAWADAIKEHDIAGLSASISEGIPPAANGLHDVSWNFVRGIVRKGVSALDLYKKLIIRALSVKGPAHPLA